MQLCEPPVYCESGTSKLHLVVEGCSSHLLHDPCSELMQSQSQEQRYACFLILKHQNSICCCFYPKSHPGKTAGAALWYESCHKYGHSHCLSQTGLFQNDHCNIPALFGCFTILPRRLSAHLPLGGERDGLVSQLPRLPPPNTLGGTICSIHL